MQPESSTEVIIYLDYFAVFYAAFWKTRRHAEEIKKSLEALMKVQKGQHVELRLLCFVETDSMVDDVMGEIVITGLETLFDSIAVTSHLTFQQRGRRHMQNVNGSALETNDLPGPEGRDHAFDPVPPKRVCNDTGEILDQRAMTEWALDNRYYLSEALKLWTKSLPYQAQYTRYYGGKDEYILQRYQEEADCRRQRIVYVDDNWTAVQSVRGLAVADLVPVSALWYRRFESSVGEICQRVRELLQDDGKMLSDWST